MSQVSVWLHCRYPEPHRNVNFGVFLHSHHFHLWLKKYQTHVSMSTMSKLTISINLMRYFIRCLRLNYLTKLMNLVSNMQVTFHNSKISIVWEDKLEDWFYRHRKGRSSGKVTEGRWVTDQSSPVTKNTSFKFVIQLCRVIWLKHKYENRIEKIIMFKVK